MTNDPNGGNLMATLPPRRFEGGRKKRLWLRAPPTGFMGTTFVTYAGMGLSLLSAPIIARTIGADGRGLLAAAFVTVQLLSWTAFLGLPRTLAVAATQKHLVSRSGMLTTTLLGVVSTVLALATADVVANGNEQLALLIRIGAPQLLFAGLAQLGMEYTLSNGRFVLWNVLRSINLILPSAAVLVAFAVGNLTFELVYAATLFGQVVTIIVGSLLCIPLLRRSGIVKIPWRFTLQYWSTSALDAVGGRIDQLLLAALAPPHVLGVYAVAVTCASAAAGATQAINDITFSRFLNAEQQAASTTLRSRSFIGLAASLTSGILVIVLINMLAVPLFGTDFKSLPTVCAILIIYQGVTDQWNLRTYWDSASLNGRGLTASSVIGLIALLGGLAVFLQFESLTGAVMAICMVAMALVRLTSRAIFRKAQDRSLRLTRLSSEA
ncbi:oligosaccharide flippase family protein [Cryobacterium ruanii]|uniref:Lipopolysaccharide biosynthesis protein n=1 Tax=Cryobacterium ruanii TaxID=1259197 RepID=A0A4R9ALF1_9MICO|nr:oligosaccharide flippase family protein [Cryobacterium ruanii]TFD63781.1 hypothetical protein E3T47_13360 [Cryobacterium ruanii]